MGTEKKKLPALPELVAPVGTDLVHVNSAGIDYKAQIVNLGGGGRKLVNVASAFLGAYSLQYTTATVSLTDIPITATRGAQIHSLVYSAADVGNLIKVSAYALITFSSSSGRFYMLLTASTEVNVLAASELWTTGIANAPYSFSNFAVYTAPSTDPITYGIRGASSNNTQVVTNGVPFTPIYSTTKTVGITIEEYKP